MEEIFANRRPKYCEFRGRNFPELKLKVIFRGKIFRELRLQENLPKKSEQFKNVLSRKFLVAKACSIKVGKILNRAFNNTYGYSYDLSYIILEKRIMGILETIAAFQANRDRYSEICRAFILVYTAASWATKKERNTAESRRMAISTASRYSRIHQFFDGRCV